MENLHKRTVTMLGKGVMRARIRKFLSFKFVQNFVEVSLKQPNIFRGVFNNIFLGKREKIIRQLCNFDFGKEERGLCGVGIEKTRGKVLA